MRRRIVSPLCVALVGAAMLVGPAARAHEHIDIGTFVERFCANSPSTVTADTDVEGGMAAISKNCTVTLADGVFLEFDAVTLTGMNATFEVDGNPGSELRVKESTVTMSGRILLQPEGDSTKTRVDESTLTAMGSSDQKDPKLRIASGPNGETRARDNRLMAASREITTGAGGECESENNTPDAPCSNGAEENDDSASA
jgi:hypothetical protein